jgi:hypothetical protein
MIVKNLNARAQNRYSGAILLAHWDRFSRQTAYRCFVKGCRNKSAVGGCVQKHAATDAGWYIIPLCDDCNRKKNQDLDIWDSARLIPVSSEIVSRVVHQGQAFRGSRVVSMPA